MIDGRRAVRESRLMRQVATLGAEFAGALANSGSNEMRSAPLALRR